VTADRNETIRDQAVLLETTKHLRVLDKSGKKKAIYESSTIEASQTTAPRNNAPPTG
jgi:hypothetical protein